MSVHPPEHRILFRLSVLAGLVYGAWWFLVEKTLPGSFNPLFPGRAAVVIYFLALAVVARKESIAPRTFRFAFAFGTWLLSAHYFYLFHHNAGDLNWIIGSYTTYVAVALIQRSKGALFAYSGFVVVSAALFNQLHPPVAQTIFLPGLITLLALVNVGVFLRLNAAKNLVESSARFEALFDASQEGIALHSDGRILAVNESFAKTFGYEKAEVIGLDVFRLVVPDSTDELIAQMKTPFDLPRRFEIIGVRKHGGRFPLEVHSRGFGTDSAGTRLVTVRDLTEVRAAEAEHVLRLTAQNAVRSRDEFISLASHELKTPLTALKLAVEMNIRNLRLGKLSDLPADRLILLLEKLNDRTNRLVEIVEDMLDVSRISMGKLQIRKERVNFSEVVRGTLESLREVIDREGGRVEVNAAGDFFVSGDAVRLEQVVVNLVTNALKYGEQKPVNVSVSANARSVLLDVSDHGMGVAPEKVELIFNRFERAISGRNISGLGLGLYISREIVHAHGGTITVRSEIEKGSTFLVELPRST